MIALRDGKTSMGKPMVCGRITSAENMAKLDRLKEISRKLALVKGLTDEEARSLRPRAEPWFILTEVSTVARWLRHSTPCGGL
jgi:hypothetical protein